MIKHFSIFLLALFSINISAQSSNFNFEEAESFLPYLGFLENEDIEWGHFTVPENWDDLDGQKIKLGVAVLRNRSKSKDSNPVVMIEGGPGGSAVEGIGWWVNHPLRETSDIIFIDARGTGFSEPRLCKDLGNKFLNILAKNQSPDKDEKEKVLAAMECKQQLIGRGIDVNQYHSKNIAKDLHAAKQYFNYSNWNVYGVSYGTYVAQVYASEFPNDVKSLILDSPISNINNYYTQNTSNYVAGLEKLFQTCKDDPNCAAEYPELEEVYYKNIQELANNPITVNVDKSIIKEGTFTYNVEDYKIAIHQALYQKGLIEVLPLLIYQFRDKNKDALSALVAAFSGALGLDYGNYYCLTCKEVTPNNSIEEYTANAKNYPKLNGGLSFYNSDFAVCNKWNEKEIIDQNEQYAISKLNMPTLIFTGKFDPITPWENGDSLLAHIDNSSLIKSNLFGHASSFTMPGFELAKNFVKNPGSPINKDKIDAGTQINFAKDIYINGGFSNLGNSVSGFDPLFLSPLLIALAILLFSIVAYIVSIIRRRKQKDWIDKIIKVLLILTSIAGVGVLGGLILALKETSAMNFYILAFGAPEHWGYLFTLLFVFLGLLLLSCLYFFVNMIKMRDRSVLFTVLFSNILLGVYFIYWGFLPFF